MTGAGAAARAPALPRAFFARDARVVARALVGATLVHELAPGDVRVARVVETEAYRGPSDPACHARFGRTARTAALFAAPGHAYVFLVYGMHLCFNVTCAREGAGHAVLLRAVEPLAGLGAGPRADGPGRLTRALGLGRAHDGVDLCGGGRVRFLEASGRPRRVATGPRVGVAYAGAAAELPLRFWDATSAGVSRPPRAAVGLGRGRPEDDPAGSRRRAAVVLGRDAERQRPPTRRAHDARGREREG